MHIGDTITELVEAVPAITGYVPTDHVVLVGLSEPSGECEIGPVVTVPIRVDMSDPLADLTATLVSGQAAGMVKAKAWQALVVTEDRLHERVAVGAVEELLVGTGVLEVNGPVRLNSYQAGEIVEGWVGADYVSEPIGDYRESPVTALVIAAGIVIADDYQQWLDNGGPEARRRANAASGGDAK